MEKHDYNLMVIGGGPGGYTAAIRGAQLGFKVCLVEKQNIGGTCLNTGCIPTKALYKSAEVYNSVKKSEEFGILSHHISINWELVQQRKTGITQKLKEGILKLIEANNITIINGEAEFVDKNRVLIKGESPEKNRISADRIIIATGSKASRPPIEDADLPGVLDSSSLLSIDHIPESLAIIGGGVIGMEFGAIFNALGSKVTVVEFLPNILAQLDSDMVKRLMPIYKKKGIEILTGSRVLKIEKKHKLELLVSTKKGEVNIEADYVLLSTGRQPDLEALKLDNAKVEYHKKGIFTNSFGVTNVPHIYAIGDVTGGIMLAHAAAHQGIAAVEHIAGLKPNENNVVPACVFTFPEIAYAGMTEDEAKSKGIVYKTSRFMFGANGKALILGEGEGFIKVICDDMDVLLGVHIMGPHASDLINEGILAIGMKLKAEDIMGIVHPHPTLGETFLEAVMGIKGVSIHSVPVKKNL
ncbi:dihydrolipoyl dehydrogenase [Oxobacter pfennigii]|uniref:Dihydrolipoyl dehydrogenase n=1 Tax=Oxobacter pfennigii TaxID=36849 RepID=A0A0P8WDH2_9CLOT|nr:dihydrolipoyl dehydrogenase [Oxobacter pfennigii]KPU45973.1 dihydrolipoyl dehydrogenase [Oxobacter pfennigii]